MIRSELIATTRVGGDAEPPSSPQVRRQHDPCRLQFNKFMHSAERLRCSTPPPQAPPQTSPAIFFDSQPHAPPAWWASIPPWTAPQAAPINLGLAGHTRTRLCVFHVMRPQKEQRPNPVRHSSCGCGRIDERRIGFDVMAAVSWPAFLNITIYMV